MDSFLLKKKQDKTKEDKKVPKEKKEVIIKKEKSIDKKPKKEKSKEKKTKTSTKKDISTKNDSPYDSDSSDEEVLIRTGDVPRKWYKDFDHAGYDIESKKVEKPAEEDEIAKFLAKAKNKDWWRNITDEMNNQTVFISDKDLAIIQRIRAGMYADKKIQDDEYFEEDLPYQMFPLSNHTPGKRKFTASHHEKKMINRLAKLIELGILKPKSELKDKPIQDLADIWNYENSNPGIYHPTKGYSMPKLEFPDHDLSYNPAPDVTDREAIDSLRKIPKYNKLINDQFDRCLDIFQSARVLKKKLDLKEEDILPKLPKPEELKPYPTRDNITFKGHDNVVKCLCVDNTGDYLISADSAGFVHFYDTLTTKILHKVHINDKIISLSFNKVLNITVVCCEGSLYFIRPVFLEKRINNDIIYSNILPKINEKIIEMKENSEDNKKPLYDWKAFDKKSIKRNGILFSIQWNDGALLSFQWHAKGDFFATLNKNQLGQSQIYIHNLSSLEYFSPLAKNKGNITCMSFHPSKPHFYVCTHSNIMIYDLKQQELIRKFVSNLKNIKHIQIHPLGSDFIVGTLEGQVAWFQADLSEKPYHIMEYHQTKIKSIAYHQSYSLFASASKDGDVLLYHGKVFDDFLQDPLIVPLNKLKPVNKTPMNDVNSIVFHPINPWIFTCGSDKLITMWS